MKQTISLVELPHTDFNSNPNGDWYGRTLHFKEETGIFPEDSYIRIWQNEQAEDYPMHWHNALEVLIPMEQHYDVTVGSTDFHLLPGEILVIPAGESHSIKAPESGRRFVLLFGTGSMSKIRGYGSMHSLIENCMYITPEGTPPIYSEVYEKFLTIVTEYFRNSEFCEFSIYANLFEILVTIARYRLNYDTAADTASALTRKKHFQRFRNVLDYIDLHYIENLSLENVASYCGFSKYHFSRLFKEYTNMNFYDYLILRRIKAAEVLLAQPSLSITEVALQSGFASISTFNRTFKKQKGCTPGEYRALYSLTGASARSGQNVTA